MGTTMQRNVELAVIILTAIAEFSSGDTSGLRHMLLAFTFGFWLRDK